MLALNTIEVSVQFIQVFVHIQKYLNKLGIKHQSYSKSKEKSTHLYKKYSEMSQSYILDKNN